MNRLTASRNTLLNGNPRIRIPYGVGKVDPQVQLVGDKPRQVRCYVQGCTQILRTPTRGFRGDVCPEHGIRCHHSSAGSTYTYHSPQRNVIASPQLFRERIIGHPFKYESHRLGSERSEDAVSWNVFRSLQEAGRLKDLAALITGESLRYEPFLYLWGICLTDDVLDPWQLLVEARKRFEGHLPVERPQTEPDIALHLPGKYLILIEAKFTSPNTFYERGPRRDGSSLTFDELLTIYHDPALTILDHQAALAAHRVPYQLWRNTVFAEWMAREDHPCTKAYHVNLVRSGYEKDTAAEFQRLVTENQRDRFHRLTWEQIDQRVGQGQELSRLRRYLRTKTAGLVKAFNL